MEIPYTLSDLVVDIDQQTVLDRSDHSIFRFSLGHGALREWNATSLKRTLRDMLDALAVIGQFQIADKIELSKNNIADVDAAAFLRHFVTHKIPLPSIDLSGNPLGQETAKAFMEVVEMEYALGLKQTNVMRFALFYDTLWDATILKQLQYSQGSPDVIQMLPIPDRVLALNHLTKNTWDVTLAGRAMWAGFIAPQLEGKPSDVHVRLHPSGERASAYVLEMTRLFYTLGLRHLNLNSLTISHVTTNETLAILRDALAPTALSFLQFTDFTPPDREAVQESMISFLQTIPSLQCVCWVDPSAEEKDACVAPKKEWMRRNKPLSMIDEETLYEYPVLVDPWHARIWLNRPQTPLMLHRVSQKAHPLPLLMSMLSLCSNVKSISLSHASWTVVQLQELLQALPSPPCCCVERVDLRNTNLVAQEILPVLQHYSHLAFDYDVQPVSLVRRLELRANEPHVRTKRQRASLSFTPEQRDEQLVHAMVSYLETEGYLPSAISFAGTNAGKEVVLFFLQFIMANEGKEHPMMSVDFSNTSVLIDAVRALPDQRFIHFFPRFIPDADAITYREIALDIDTIVPFIEGGGTDAASVRLIRHNDMFVLWPGRFSLPSMYTTYFKILANRASRSIRSFTLLDRPCSTMNMRDVTIECISHLKSLEYVLFASPQQWDVSTRTSRKNSAEANEVAINRMISAAVEMLVGGLPELRQIDIVPPKLQFRPLCARWVDHLNETTLSSFKAKASYLHRLPNYVSFVNGIVDGRVFLGADNVLLNSDSTHLPFASDDILLLMSRSGHGQRFLSLANRGINVTDNTLIALYTTAVAPLESVDFSGTAVTMTGIQLLAEHAELQSPIHTLYFSNIPSLMRLPAMDMRPSLFGGIPREIAAPTPLMTQRMRLAQTIRLIGAPPPVKRYLPDAEKKQLVMSLTTGDEITRFLQRVDMILRLSEFTVPLKETSMQVHDILYDWTDLPDTLVFTSDTKEITLLFLSFFRFAALHQIVHRIVFDDSVALDNTPLERLMKLPGMIEFTLHNSSGIRKSFWEDQWLNHVDSPHTVVLRDADGIPEGVKSNDHLAILSKENVFLSAGLTAVNRHLPWLFHQVTDKTLHLRGLPLACWNALVDSNLTLKNVEYLALTEMTEKGDESLFQSDKMLRVFPSLQNVILTMKQEDDRFKEVLLPFHFYQSPSAFYWTDAKMGALLRQSTDLMGSAGTIPPVFHLWMHEFQPPFPLDVTHLERWKLVVHAFGKNFSSVRILNLRDQRVSIQFFSPSVDAFVHIDEYRLEGMSLASNIAERVWVDLERVVRLRGLEHPTRVLLDDAQFEYVRTHHPLLFALLPNAPSSAVVALPEESNHLFEDAHVLRGRVELSESAIASFRSWEARQHGESNEWMVVPLNESEVDVVLHVLGHQVIDALAQQQLPLRWAYVAFGIPRSLVVHRSMSVLPSPVAAEEPNHFIVVLNLSNFVQQVQYAAGIVTDLSPMEFAIVRHDDVLLNGNDRIALLSLELFFFEVEVPWSSTIGNDLYNRMHRIENQEHLPSPPPMMLPFIPDVEMEPAPPLVVPERVEHWGISLEQAMVSLNEFLLNKEANATMTPFLTLYTVPSSKEKVLWIGYYLNRAVHVRVVSFADASMAETAVKKFKSNLKKQPEHTLMFQATIPSELLVTFEMVAKTNPANRLILKLARANIRSISVETMEAKYERFYPYAELSALPLPETIIPPAKPIPEVVTTPAKPIPDKDYYEQMQKETEEFLGGKEALKEMVQEVKKMKLEDTRSYVEKQGFTYVDYLGRGVSSHVVRLKRVSDGKEMAVKMYFEKDAYDLEFSNTAAFSEEDDYVVQFIISMEFDPPMKMEDVLGQVASDRIRLVEKNAFISYAGMTGFTLMDGSLYSQGIVSSYHNARFLLKLQSSISMQQTLLAWMKHVEEKFAEKRYLHGDLEARNILFLWDEATDTVVYRVADFGMEQPEIVRKADIQYEWERLRSNMQRRWNAKNYVIPRRRELWKNVSVTYDASLQQLWIAESGLNAHVFLYTGVVSAPSWNHQWFETFNMTFETFQPKSLTEVPVVEQITFETPEEIIVKGSMEVILYAVEYHYTPPPRVTNWVDFLLHSQKDRKPSIKVMTGELELRVGFVDKNHLFEYVTIRMPSMEKRAAINLQKRIHPFFKEQNVTAFQSISLERDVLTILLTYDDHKTRTFSIESKGMMAMDHIQSYREQAPDVTLSSLGYEYEKTLDTGQESIVILVKKNGIFYAMKLFRKNANFEEFRRASFVNPSVILNNFYETEQDAYQAIQTIPSFAVLQPFVLEYVEGASLPSMKASRFVGKSTGEQDDTIVGYIVLAYMDGDLNLLTKLTKKRRTDFDVLFDLRHRNLAEFQFFVKRVQHAMESLSFLHVDLHLYNFFYKRLANGTFQYRLGDLATLRRGDVDAIVAEWNHLLYKEIPEQLEPAPVMLIDKVEKTKGTLTYAAERQLLVVRYEGELFETQLYVIPLGLNVESFASEENGIISIGMELDATAGLSKKLVLSFTDGQSKEGRTFSVESGKLEGVEVYKFQNPTMGAVEESKEYEELPTGKVAEYKPKGGKYSADRWMALLAHVNVLLANKEMQWNVTMEKDANNAQTLFVFINGVKVMSVLGLLASRVEELLKQTYLSVEGMDVIVRSNFILFRVELRTQNKEGKKKRSWFPLKAFNMASFDIQVEDASLKQVMETAVPKERPVPTLRSDEPMVFYHAFQTSEKISDKVFSLYDPSLRNQDGQTLYQALTKKDRTFFIVDVRLVILPGKFAKKMKKKVDLLLIIAEDVAADNTVLGRYAFGVYHFSHDTKRMKRMVINPFEYFYKQFQETKQDTIWFMDFYNIPSGLKEVGAFTYYKNEKDATNFVLSLDVWEHATSPLMMVVIPSFKEESVLSTMNDLITTYKEKIRSASAIEETEEEEDEYAEVVAETNDLVGDDNLEEDDFIAQEEEEPAAEDVEMMHQVEFGEATKRAYKKFVKKITHGPMDFSLRGMSASVANKTLLFRKFIEEKEVFRFVMVNVDFAKTFEVDKSLLDVLVNSRFNHGNIRIDIIPRLKKKIWKCIMTVDDTWSGVRAFLKALLPKMLSTPDASPSHIVTYGLMEARQTIERKLLECDGEDCTLLLLKMINAPATSSVEEQVGIMEQQGWMNYGSPSTLFLTAERWELLLTDIRRHEKEEEHVLVLILIHEYVTAHESVSGKYNARQRAFFFETYQRTFPSQLEPQELEVLQKTYKMDFFKKNEFRLLRLQTKIVSKKKLKMLTKQTEVDGLEIVTLSFA